MMPGNRGLSVSKKQCCDIVGWTAYQFDNAVRAGMPVVEHPTSRQTDYIVFMGDVIRWLVEREVRALGLEPVKKLDLNEERARLAKEQADKTELENKLARGELVRASDVLKTGEVFYTGIRDRVTQVASVAPLLYDAAVSEAGLPKVRELLRQALVDALEEVGSAGVEAEAEEAPAAA
jgi:phage terminase Nu1 subunit (DNA packaging protein)